MSDIKFMWRMQPYPTEGSRGGMFVKQVTDTLDYIQGKFDGAFLDDHLLPFTAVDHSGGREALPNDVDVFESMTTPAYFVAAYPKLVFGPIVLCQSYRNPALVAKMGANIQQLSNGRFIMGIGAGWYQPDYDAYGYEFSETPSVRLAQMEEAIQIIYKMWRESPATFEGKYYHIKNAYCSPAPNPIPPLMMGMGGEKIALRMVAKYADWWNYCDTPDVYAHKLEVLRAHCDAVGRNFDDIVKTWDGLQIAIAGTEEEARRIYEKSIFRRKEALVGNPDQITEKLKAYLDLGVKIFFLRFDDFPQSAGLKLFTEEVMPRLK